MRTQWTAPRDTAMGESFRPGLHRGQGGPVRSRGNLWEAGGAHNRRVAGQNPAPATNVLDCRREIDQYVSLALTYVEVRLHYAYAESDRVFA